MPQTSTGAPYTLAEVAAAAGVSVPTVSKVINGRADVAPATRARVEQVIAAHGYVINKAGRSLRRGRNGQIDFVVQSLNSDYAAQILRGVEEALAATEVRVMLAVTRDAPQGDRQWIERIADGATDGAVVVPAPVKAMNLEALRRRGIPFVVVDPMAELGAEDLSVSATNWAGGKSAAQYLLSLGHRRIAALLGPAALPCTQDRLAGFRAAHEEAGVAVDAALIRYSDWFVEPAYQEMCNLLALPAPPTAVFAGSDQQCLGIFRALYEHRLRIPEAMSVVGFDDMPYAQWMTPALTTVRQPLLEMGRTATKMLLRLMAGEPVDTVRVEVGTPLIRRASCGPPRPDDAGIVDAGEVSRRGGGR